MNGTRIEAVVDHVIIALLTNLALGALVCLALGLTLRSGTLPGRADIRFAIVFAALTALALALPIAWDAAARPAVYPLAGQLASSQQPAVAPPTVRSMHAKLRVSTDRLKRDRTFGTMFPAALSVIWVIGIVVSVLRLGLGLLRLRGIVGQASIIAMGTSRRGATRVIATDAFRVPVAIGYRRPAIALPNRLIACADEVELEHVIAHERMHLERYDDLSSLIQSLLIAVLWFNPFAHVLSRRIAIEREMACDEAVTASLFGRRAYLKTLLRISNTETALPRHLVAFGAQPGMLARTVNLLVRARSSGRAVAAAASLGMLLALSIVGTAWALPRFVPAGRRIPWGASMTRLHDGSWLILGGITDRGVTNDAERYDPLRHRLIPLGHMLFARVGESATVLADGRVLIVGGQSTLARYVHATELYDPRTETFARTADSDGRVDEHARLLADGEVLIFGGAMGGGPAHCVILYDPRTHGYRQGGHLIRRLAGEIVTRFANGRIAHYRLARG